MNHVKYVLLCNYIIAIYCHKCHLRHSLLIVVPVRIFDLASRSLPHRQGNVSAVIDRPLSLGCASSYDSALQDRTDVSWFKDGTRLSAPTVRGEPGPTFVSLSDEVLEVFDGVSTELEAMEKLRRFLNGRAEDESIFGLLERPDPGSRLIIRKLELEMSKVIRSHGGLYECRVTSPGGRESVSTLVTVIGEACKCGCLLKPYF